MAPAEKAAITSYFSAGLIRPCSRPTRTARKGSSTISPTLPSMSCRPSGFGSSIPTGCARPAADRGPWNQA